MAGLSPKIIPPGDQNWAGGLGSVVVVVVVKCWSTREGITMMCEEVQFESGIKLEISEDIGGLGGGEGQVCIDWVG